MMEDHQIQLMKLLKLKGRSFVLLNTVLLLSFLAMCVQMAHVASVTNYQTTQCINVCTDKWLSPQEKGEKPKKVIAWNKEE